MNPVINHKTIFQDLGNIDYKRAWDYQEKLFAEIIDLKLRNRTLPTEKQKLTPNYLLFCEHPHVYTLGKSGNPENLLMNKEQLETERISFYRINRGGDITYHGPGQLVGYPIIDLDNFFTDIHQYLRLLEEAVILTMKEFEIDAGRIPELTGVWIDYDKQINPRKICAIGVRSSRWVTMHGFALNVNTDLNFFDQIIPCGIRDKSVTSISQELGNKISMEEVKNILKRHIGNLFEMEFDEQDSGG